MNVFYQSPLFWFLAVSLVVWIFRAKCALHALEHSPVVDPNERLSEKNSSSPQTSQPMISIIIPAKNEEKNIVACVSALQDQDYPNYEIIVANDSSSDQTEALLQSLGAVQLFPKDSQRQPLSSKPLQYFNCPKTPEGWTGKNYALDQAIPFAQGTWFLFTDADTRHETSSLSASMAHVQDRDLRMLTLYPRCLTKGFTEKLLQPAALVYIGLWFPLEKINNPDEEAYFGNGQYLFVEKKLYTEIQGHEKVRDSYLEDFDMLKNAKEHKARVQCALGASVFGTRMYESVDALWRGWRRIYMHAFGSQWLKITLKMLSVFLFSVLPVVLFAPLTYLAWMYPASYGFIWGFSFPILALMVITIWKAHTVIKAPRGFAFFHVFAAFFITMVLMDAAWMSFRKAETIWR